MYYFIHQFTNMEEMARKKMGVAQTFKKVQTIQKVNFVITKIMIIIIITITIVMMIIIIEHNFKHI